MPAVRKVFAIVAALIGGYLLWMGVKFGRVLLIMKDTQIDGPMLTIAAVLVGLGIGFMALGWWLFRNRPPAIPPGTPPRP